MGGEVSGGVEFQEQITSFSDDAVKLDEYLVSDRAQSFDEVSSAADTRVHTIIDFLERPRIVNRTVWSTIDEANTTIIDLKIPDILLDSMNLNKLDGFASFSASVEIKVQINAQPFQAGLLILAACPAKDLIGERNDVCKFSIDKSLCLPHVLFDISKTSEISLTIPYVSPLQQYDLIRRQYAWSDFFVKIYSKFVSNQSDSVDVLVWARFKDVKLGVPTALPIKTNLQLQIGEQSGPISGVVGTITDVVESVGNSASKYLPSLKKFLKPGAQIGRGIQGLISALGFSKPQQLEQCCPIVLRPGCALANTDGLDTGVPMSARQSNSIEFMPAFAGSSADELSLDYVLRIPNYIDTFTYTTSGADKILWSSLVSPLYNSKFTFSDNEKQPTNLKYISSMYEYWRGSLKYTFRFVKTNYHSGRIEFVFSPFSDNSLVNQVSIDTRSEFCYRLVGDLREQTEFSFLVPYVSTTDYKLITPSIDPLSTQPASITDFVGCIAVRALTPLQLSQALLPNSIDCVVEVAAGPDFELASPIGSYYQPISAVVEPSESSALRLEAGDTFGSTGTRDIRSTYIDHQFVPQCITGDQRMCATNPKSAARCIGEPTISLRELIKRPQYFSYCKVGKYINLIRIPQKINSNPPRFDLGNETTTDISITNIMRISSLYAFVRGGVNLKFFFDKNYDQNLCCVRLLSILGGKDNVCVPTSFESVRNKSICEFSFPFYSRIPYVPVYAGAEGDAPNVYPTWYFQVANTKARAYISAADDFDLGYFLGPPRCTTGVPSGDFFPA